MASTPPSPDRSDRRVLVIAAITMVGLVLVGAVSAHLLARSACLELGSEPVAARAAGTEVAAVVEDAMVGLSDDERGAVQGMIGALAPRLGPLTGVADVRGAERLALLDGGRIGALGSITTLLDADLTSVRATAATTGGVIEGGGDALYLLALVNPVTGQIDAVLPLEGDLKEGSCVDTATVGSPLAFRLAVGGGELLLLRVQDDGERAAVELRNEHGDRVWQTPIELASASPGRLAEGLSGGVGDRLAVVGRRFHPDEEEPAVVAFERGAGAVAWTVGPQEIAAFAPDPVGEDDTVRVEVVLVGEELVLLALSRDATGPAATFVALAAASGRPAFDVDLGPRPLEAAASADGALLLAVREEGVVTAYEVDPASGATHPRASAAGDQVSLARFEERVVLAVDQTLVVAGPDVTDSVAGEVVFADLLVVDDGIVLLLDSGDGAVAVGYGPG